MDGLFSRGDESRHRRGTRGTSDPVQIGGLAASLLFIAASAGCATGSSGVQAPSAPNDMSAMMSESKAFDATAAQFVALARAGDVDGMLAMSSANELRLSGRATVADIFRTRVVPFFKTRAPEANYATIARATDDFGSSGYAFYRFAADAYGKDRRPFSIYVVREAGRLVVGNVTVDVFVNGRHG